MLQRSTGWNLGIAVLPDALKRTHALFNRIENLKAPIVAGIHGFCLGGGLELALACHYRIAVNNDATRIGFPEVNLGLKGIYTRVLTVFGAGLIPIL